MTQPDVTVCIATCNQLHYIDRCVSSVLGQTGGLAIEVLIGDDCSEDGTSEALGAIAKSWPEIVSYIRHSERLGASANLQTLLARAKGRFIARVDGDDYWLEGKLRRQVDFLDAHPECAAVYSNAITMAEDGQEIGRFNDVGDAQFDLAALLRRGNFLNSSSMMFRASFVGPWLAVEEPMLDYRAHLMMARNGLLGHIGEPLAAYRMNAAGSMVREANDRVRELYWQAIMDVPREAVGDHDMALGIADFIRRVAYRSISTRRPSLLRAWWPRAAEAAPCGKPRLAAMVLASFLRTARVEVMARIRSGQGGAATKVLYRR